MSQDISAGVRPGREVSGYMAWAQAQMSHLRLRMKAVLSRHALPAREAPRGCWGCRGPPGGYAAAWSLRRAPTHGIRLFLLDV